MVYIWNKKRGNFMDQKKIGIFIATKRAEKHITQSELGERLGVTDRAISNWENGKNMPDLSLFKPICEELDITINELLSGEKLEENVYQEKLEENIIDIVNKVNEKEQKNRKKIIIVILLVVPIMLYLTYINVTNIELDVRYDDRVMKCHFEDNYLKYEIKGISIINTDYEEVKINNEKIYFFTSKIYLENKIRSHWETWENMADLLNDEKISYASEIKIEVNKNDIIKVYHTNIPISKIKKATKEELKEIINNSNFMCQYNN